MAECYVTSVWQYGREGTVIPTENQLSLGMMSTLSDLRSQILLNHRQDLGKSTSIDIRNLHLTLEIQIINKKVNNKL